MQALKKFLSSVHFVTLTTLCSLSLLLFIGLLDLPNSESLQEAKASVSRPLDPLIIPIVNVPGNTPADEALEIRGELLEGDSLGKSLQRCNVLPGINAQILKSLGELIDFRKLRPGSNYSIRVGQNNELLQCVFTISPLESYTITKTDNGYLAERDKKFLEARKVRISGEIKTTLFDAFPRDIKSPKLIYAFADIFSSRLDFNTETRSGDTFNLIVEEYYLFDDFIGYGPILAGKYDRAGGEHFEAFRYSPEANLNSYFDRDGHELRASFLRSPVGIGRVSSRFSWRRKHPILGVTRQHLGVDLAAPLGTPVMAAADGKIVSLGFNGGFGKQIIIAHGNDYRTHYGHLSKFAKTLKVGSRVNQKQIIGYVGSTGLSTGPHLDYRVQHHGTFKNPFALAYRPKSTLNNEKLAGLRASINPLLAELFADGANRLLNVSSLTIDDGQQLSLL